MDDPLDDYNNYLKRAREEYGRLYYEARAKELGVPLVDLTIFKPEADALACVPCELARHHNVIPLRRQAKALWLAIANPNDLTALDDIRLACRCTIKPVLADPSMIRASIERFYADHD